MEHYSSIVFHVISIHAPRVGSDLWLWLAVMQRRIFQSTLPVWGATFGFNRFQVYFQNFNPRSPCGERRVCLYTSMASKPFQSTLPVWGATTAEFIARYFSKDFNPRSPCGERPMPSFALTGFSLFQSTLPVWGATEVFELPAMSEDISIHAPRVGSDLQRYFSTPDSLYFNPRSPCGERRFTKMTKEERIKFQSTLPVWGATSSVLDLALSRFKFQSTLPVWGATFQAFIIFPFLDYFNPRSPCGERRVCLYTSMASKPFQSTLPVWGATYQGFKFAIVFDISIHAPRVGSDDLHFQDCYKQSVFQSTLPVWGATIRPVFVMLSKIISIHAPRVGSD